MDCLADAAFTNAWWNAAKLALFFRLFSYLWTICPFWLLDEIPVSIDAGLFSLFLLMSRY